MKKTVGLIAVLMVCSGLSALPVYNPAEPQLLTGNLFFRAADDWGLEIGYRGDYVLDRKLKVKNSSNLWDDSRDVCKYRTSIDAIQLTVDLCDRVDLYGWIGIGETVFNTQVGYRTALSAQLPLADLAGATQSGSAFGFGARAVLWSCGRTAVGVDAQYGHSKSQLECLTVDGVPIQGVARFAGISRLVDPADLSVRNNEFQVSLGISHRLCRFIPYIALKYSNAHTKFKGPNADFIRFPTSGAARSSLQFESRCHVGLVLGATLVAIKAFQVTLEGRFIDEQAATLVADLRF
jgi:hypothetical protein